MMDDLAGMPKVVCHVIYIFLQYIAKPSVYSKRQKEAYESYVLLYSI